MYFHSVALAPRFRKQKMMLLRRRAEPGLLALQVHRANDPMVQ